MSKCQRALISVSDKTGVVEFARELAVLGIELVSTGGTSRALKNAGVPVVEISELTGFPEMLDGRVKTLHPKIHGGLLYLRGNTEHEAQAAKHGIKPIDLVVVNLYPFEQTPAIENIDVGGPALLRSAAKNHASVTVVVNPADYPQVLHDLKEHCGNTCEMFRWKLAVKAFETTARYDAAIAQYLHAERMKARGKTDAAGTAAPLFPETLNFSLKKTQDLRYGENPHQQAALYGDFSDYFHQLHGKELSFNNILDLSAAADLVGEFDEPAVAIVKHTNPCGVGCAPTLVDAWRLAYETDKQSAFGGIIAVNRPLDTATAEAIAGVFSEVVVAPMFGSEALAILQTKKNLRLIRHQPPTIPHQSFAIRCVTGGVLVQEHDARLVSAADIKVVTKRAPTKEERHALLFAWRLVKHVKSNAIVFARGDAGGNRTLGIGAGQMSRVDAVKVAVWKAGEAGLDLRGSVVASDGFFPFPDGLRAAAEAGASAAIQPGGSVNDADVIAVAESKGMAVVFTGIRHFRH